MDGPSQNWHLEDVAASSWPSVASLDLYRGTRLVDVDGSNKDEVMGVINRLLGMHGR
jgi:hypothetical protein